MKLVLALFFSPIYHCLEIEFLWSLLVLHVLGTVVTAFILDYLFREFLEQRTWENRESVS